MNCTCINDMARRLTHHAAEMMGAINPVVSPTFTSIQHDGSLALNLVYVLHADNAPYTKAKGVPLNAVATHCPFCGAPLQKPVAPSRIPS